LLAALGYRNLLQLTLNLSQLTALWWRKYMPAVAAYLRGADAGAEALGAHLDRWRCLAVTLAEPVKRPIALF
jgi:hypothetical protein